MVFCYKTITESPRRSCSASPRKCSPIQRYPISRQSISEISGIVVTVDYRSIKLDSQLKLVDDASLRYKELFSRFEDQDTLSDFVAAYDYENNVGDVWSSIPERDWRLFAALAKKREEEQERERLSEQFQKMWLREKEEREMVEAEISEQYKKYIHKKRWKERMSHDYQRMLRKAEQQAKTGRLVDCIRYKEKRSADLLAWRDDLKTTQLMSKAVEEEARTILAAERRFRHSVTDMLQKKIDVIHTLKKSDDACNRKNAMLKEASQRLAIRNALTSWGTSLIRQEVEATDAARRSYCAAQNAAKDAKYARLTLARNIRTQRARKLAAITAQMRDFVRGTT